MQNLIKIIPLFLACILGVFIFLALVANPSHMSKQNLQKLQAKNPKMQVSRPEQGSMLQFEVYGKPAEHKYRVQALLPGTAILYDADGKAIMKLFVESGDVLVKVPKEKTVDVVAFQPFEWVE